MLTRLPSAAGHREGDAVASVNVTGRGVTNNRLVSSRHYAATLPVAPVLVVSAPPFTSIKEILARWTSERPVWLVATSRKFHYRIIVLIVSKPGSAVATPPVWINGNGSQHLQRTVERWKKLPCASVLGPELSPPERTSPRHYCFHAQNSEAGHQ